MAIQKPYGVSIKNQIIDASQAYTIKWKTSGDTSSSFSIDVFKNIDGSSAWSLPRNYSFANSYTIPAQFVPNGWDYKLRVTVYDAIGNLAHSDYVIFTASSSPTITVDPIDTVTNHSYLFTGHYFQAENELLQSYTVNLYDSNKGLVGTSGILTDGLVQYLFDLLVTGFTYYVEFIVVSTKGLSTSSGLISFNVNYINPYLNMKLQGENIPDSAGIQLSWETIQIIGKTTSDPVYLNNEELDVVYGKVYFDEGFSIDNNFNLKMWFKEMITNVDLIHLKGSNGDLRVQFETDKRFHLYKEISGFTSHYASQQMNKGYFISPYQYVSNGEGNAFFLCLQQNNAMMDMVASSYNIIQSNSLSGTTFNQIATVTFNNESNVTF